MSYPIGSLVRARGREWVVLPESEDGLLLVRPLGGSAEEATGIWLPLERVEPATFDLPDPSKVGDHRSSRLLRDAVRLSTRSSAGPFRSFGRIAVEPRPYQIVPLLMALKLDPVRLLIADDVGIGKTIEACLVARELLDRGEADRLAVLTPPHLAEQWQLELSSKFHIEAELVLPSTASRLERPCRLGQSLFELYPYTVVSTDFIKSDRRRVEFARVCPDLVIVDEAHTCAFGYEGRGSRQQRFELVKELAARPNRHLILVTATPHSGKEEAFRSLLGFLDPDFTNLPADLTGPEKEHHRKRLAAHLVQRRRADIRHFLQADTPFPEREEKEQSYRFSPEYRRFFDRVYRYTRETVAHGKGSVFAQRIRWWSALALLRSVGSSPAAAAATLRNRSPALEAQTSEEVEEFGRRAVLDMALEDQAEGSDLAPGSDPGEENLSESSLRRRLLDLAREADRLRGEADAKLLQAVEHVRAFLRDGFHPIVFCRFIPTAEYVAEELRGRLPSDTEVACVTGLLPPADREARVAELAQKPKRVLVCTDCLSEGINLQEHFDAVMHYDLAWNPTRHEQREGRVDRFGQPRKTVRVLTYYGADNPIDGIVLDVLLRKHKKIRSSLGVSVSVPLDTSAVVEAIFEGVLLRGKEPQEPQDVLPGLEEYLGPSRKALHNEWDQAASREKRSRTLFAQESFKVDEVARELEEARAAVGLFSDVSRFTLEALRAHRAVIAQSGSTYKFDLRETPRSLRDALECHEKFEASFELPVEEGVLYLTRTHPIVERLAAYVMETALDPVADGVARRAGAIRTRAVRKRTTLLVLRFRYDIVSRTQEGGCSQLAEECGLLAFEGAPAGAEWLDPAAAESLLAAQPAANIEPEQAKLFVSRVLEGFDLLAPALEKEAFRRAGLLLDAHRRLRAAARLRKVTYHVEPKLPPDVLGIYVYLPALEEAPHA